MHEMRTQHERTRHRRSFRPRLQAGLALAAVAALAATVLVTADGPGRDGSGTGAPGPLRSAALVAARDDRIQVGDGEYLYLRLEGQATGTMDVAGEQMTALIPTETEVWVSNEGSGRLLTRTSDPKFLSEEDRKAWEAAGSPVFSEVGAEDERFEAGELFPQEDLAAYPTAPDALHATLLDQAGAAGESPGRDPDGYVFTLSRDLLLRFPQAPPDLRSALFEVLGRVPGTEIVGDARDPARRPAAMVALTVAEDRGASQRHEVFFDPSTAQVVGFRDVFLEGGESPDDGDVHSYGVLLDSGVVRSETARPRA